MARKSRYEDKTSQDMPRLEEPNILAAAYVRISVDDGDNEVDESIVNQQKIIRAFLGTHTDISLVQTYIDNGYSGMNCNRPGFQRMLQDLNEGIINCVIVKDISRFGRNFIITSEFVEKTFPQMGIRLICINDNFDSIDKDANVSDLIMPLKMVLNDEYARDISKKIRSSLTTMMKSGEFLPASGSIPYGYLRNTEKCTYDVDEETRPVVVRIFEERALGVSYNEIAKRLNLDNIPSPGRLRYLRGQCKKTSYQNAVWLRGAIKDIVSDRTYLGEKIHGKMRREDMDSKKETRPADEWLVIKGAHPAIITEELFERVQNVNQEVKTHRSHFRRRTDIVDNYRDAFLKKLFCADCGAPMSVHRQRRLKENSKTSISYECGQYTESQHIKCSSHRISQEMIISKIKNAIETQIKLSIDLQAIITSIQRSPIVEKHFTDLRKNLSSLRVKKNNAKEKIENLLVDLVNGLITREEYEYMRWQYQSQLDKIDSDEQVLLEKIQQWKKIESDTLNWISLVQNCFNAPEISKELMNFLIDKVYVFKDGSIQIEFYFSDTFAPVLSFLSGVVDDQGGLVYEY